MVLTERIFINAVKGKISSRPPIWIMRQAGRYLPEYRELRKNAGSFLNLCFNPDLACEVTLQPIRRFGFDAAIIFSDILVIPYSLGSDLDYMEGEGPKLSRINSTKDVESLKCGRSKEKLKPVFSAIKKVRENLSSDKSLIGFAGAPWTVSTYMVEGGGGHDFENCKKFIKEDKNTYLKLIEILVLETVEYLCMQIEAGADVLQIFESWAGAVPQENIEEFIYHPTKKIVCKVKEKHPQIKIIGFPKGIGKNINDYVNKTGIDAVGIDDSFDIGEVSRQLPGTTLQGNLSNEILANGSAEEVEKAAIEILDKMKGRPHIFNLGHGILPKTPMENVEILVETVRGYKESLNEREAG